MNYLGLDIGSNSVGSAWIDQQAGTVTAGTSIFPAGVDESDDKRGDPKNVKRRMTRHTRVTLARRAERKRLLRIKLISVGLLPSDKSHFKKLLDDTDPWILRRKGLDEQLTPHEFGRALLHLAQHRGALGLKIADVEEEQEEGEDGKVKAAITAVRAKMKERSARTFGEFMSMVRAERVTAITSVDRRPPGARKGPREYRGAIRNKAANYEHCADRTMIHDEFAALWKSQKDRGGPLANILTDELRLAIDDESGDSVWRQRGLMFGQRRTYWDTGTLGRCDLEPTERCVPHADMYASRYLVVETVNNIKIIERGAEPRTLTPDERQKIKIFLSGPLGLYKGLPKRSASVTDLRKLMGWGGVSKTAPFRFNLENDEDRVINTDWFSREIAQGAVTVEKWESMSDGGREGINRAILRYDPDEQGDAEKLKALVMKDWAGLTEAQADALISAWQRRPRPDAKQLKMSRRAVRNLLVHMDRLEPSADPNHPGQNRWVTQIEARKLIADDANFLDVTTGKPLADQARPRYATGAKGATARDRHYMRKHLLMKNGEPIFDPDGNPLHEPPPVPMISNPVVRKAIHEVRRHLIEYMVTFGKVPDNVHIELSREAKMGKKQADALLLKNRLRNRIRNDIVASFDHLRDGTTTQQRAGVDRVVLCEQQRGVCPLCGKAGLTDRLAAKGEGCEVAHIIPRGSGGHNGLGNIVLAHTKCNRDMARRTPREFWNTALPGGFNEGIAWVEQSYGGMIRPNPGQVKTATGNSLWSCYFTKRDDTAKIEQFKKDVKDIQQMTNRQDAATKYAARQVMAYIAGALYDGNGLPERGGDRKIFSTDGMWTGRLRREWGLFFDPHKFKTHGLSAEEEHLRKEKNRGDHRHHAIDAIVVAASTPQIRNAWDEREKRADRDGVNTANDEEMETYRRQHRLPPPPPFHNHSHEEFREAVRRAVFGEAGVERPICHRPVKRKLIGKLHEETLFGTVPDKSGKLTDNFTAKKSVLNLDPNHLRLPRPKTEAEAIDRLAARKLNEDGVDERTARKWAKGVVTSKGYKPAIVDPPPGKPGIVRDIALRKRLRQCISDAGLNPDNFSAGEMKKLVESGAIRHASGVPIKSVVLLRIMSDPVVTSRWANDHVTGNRFKVYDGATGQGDATGARAYVGGNNHHIEIRMTKDKKGKETWSGEIVTSFQAAQRKLAKHRAFREAGIPKPSTIRKLSEAERTAVSPILRAAEQANPIVDRRDSEEKGGTFVMSLAEGEILKMRRKGEKGNPGEVGYFVIAKLDKPQSIVLVPHWDARSATERKDSDGKKVPDSKREQFAVTPTDLKDLAPPGHAHAVKVRVSPLGVITELHGD